MVAQWSTIGVQLIQKISAVNFARGKGSGGYLRRQQFYSLLLKK